MTSLKIKYNPFAKAFLDAKERPEATFARENSQYWVFQNQSNYINAEKFTATNRTNHRSVPYTTKPPQHITTRVAGKLPSSPVQTPPCENSAGTSELFSYFESFYLFSYSCGHFFLSSPDYTLLESTNHTIGTYPATTWQPSICSGTSYWTNQVSVNSPVASPNASNLQSTQHHTPPRSPISPNCVSGSPSYHQMTSQNPNIASSSSSEAYTSNSPHYTTTSQSPIVPMPQTHQLYYPSSLSPNHQIYGNVIGSTTFGNFGYSGTTAGWHGAGEYSLFHNAYHYQPTDYILPR